MIEDENTIQDPEESTLDAILSVLTDSTITEQEELKGTDPKYDDKSLHKENLRDSQKSK